MLCDVPSILNYLPYWSLLIDTPFNEGESREKKVGGRVLNPTLEIYHKEMGASNSEKGNGESKLGQIEYDNCKFLYKIELCLLLLNLF